MFKNLTTLLLVSVTATVFSGCGYTPLPEQHFQKKEVLIEKNSDNTTRFFGTGINLRFVSGGYKQTAERISELKEAAYYGKHHGYKYFAIKSDKFNNMLGLPITNINSLIRYCSYPTSESSEYNSGDCGGLGYRTDVYFFKKNPNAFPVWNIDDVINEKIDISYLINDDRKKALVEYLKNSSINFK